MMKLLSLLAILIFTLAANAEVRFVRALFHGDASAQIRVSWDQSSGKALEFVYAEDPSFSDAVTITKFRKSGAKKMNTRGVRLCGLKADQRYYFKIIDSKGSSRVWHFDMAPNINSERLSFIAGGDSRSNRDIRVLGNQIVAKVCAHAVLFNGDFTAYDTAEQWKNWFIDWEQTTSKDGRITPLVITRGNHERSNGILVKLFDVPDSKVLYSSQFGGDLLNVICLNTEIKRSGKQKKFLQTDLEAHKDFDWQIPQYHRPIRAHVSFKQEMQEQYIHWVPFFEAYKNVGLCLENDSHTCKVTWPVLAESDSSKADEGFVRADGKGIVYAGEGCWGAPLRAANDTKSWTRDAEMVNQVNWIFVDSGKIELRCILYENAAEVGTLNRRNRFDFPENIQIWSPSNGANVEIFPRN